MSGATAQPLSAYFPGQTQQQAPRPGGGACRAPSTRHECADRPHHVSPSLFMQQQVPGITVFGASTAGRGLMRLTRLPIRGRRLHIALQRAR